MRFIHRLALLLAIIVTSVNLTSANPQSKSKPMPSQSRVAKSPEQMASDNQVELLLGKSGLRAKKVADGVWVIRMEGKVFPYFQVMIASGPGYVLSSVVIANKRSLKFDSDLGYRLLRLAHELNYIKVGVDNGDDLFVRSELRLKLLDAEEFRMMIDRLAAAADKAYEQVKPSLIFIR